MSQHFSFCCLGGDRYLQLGARCTMVVPAQTPGIHTVLYHSSVPAVCDKGHLQQCPPQCLAEPSCTAQSPLWCLDLLTPAWYSWGRAAAASNNAPGWVTYAVPQQCCQERVAEHRQHPSDSGRFSEDFSVQGITGISCSFTDLAIYIAAFTGAELGRASSQLTPDSYSSEQAILTD